MLKSAFKSVDAIKSIYSGGTVANKPALLSAFTDSITLTLDGVSTSICGDEAISTFCATPNHIVVAYASLLIKIFDYPGLVLKKSFKAHQAPVLSMDTDSTCTLFATGSADSTIRVYDIEQGYATHSFKGHSGIVSIVKFHPSKLILVSGDGDGKIRVWDLMKKNCVGVLDTHVSVVRGLDFSDNGEFLYSVARDQVLCSWDLSKLSILLTIPAYETLESIVRVTLNGKSYLCTGGEKGVLKLWDAKTGQCVHQIEDKDSSKQEISALLYDQVKSELLVVTSDQNLLFYHLGETLELTKQMAGYNEQILDLAIVGKDIQDPYLAVITNTEQIRLYNVKTKNCDIVHGHTEIILSVSTSQDGSLLMTGSKDKTAKIWSVDLLSKSKLELIGDCLGHTEAVSTVCLPNKSSQFAITGSQDRTIKVWNLNSVNESKISAKFTFQAHEKDIQSIAIAPNDKIFASASLDKTAKVWSVEDGELLGVCKGHKRGIWKVSFSPVDQILATCSTDKTIKLWNVKDFTCIKTFEGHLNSVLNVSFINAGLQLISAGSDGLVKLWNIKGTECVGTFDNHEDRIWALEVLGDEYVFTGSADSTVCVWKDVTAEEVAEKQEQDEQTILKEQDLSLYLVRKDYRNAVALAMELNQPYRILTILKECQKLNEQGSVTGSTSLDEYLSSLTVELLQQLLLYIRDWNTVSKHAPDAQMLLGLIISSYPQSTLLGLPKIKEVLDALVVYSQRHLVHATETLKQTYFIEYTLHEMQQLSL